MKKELSERAGIKTVELFKPSPAKPILVSGLPGSGYVGKLAVEHLVTVFRARKFREYHSPTFPPHATIGENGVVRTLRGELYFAQTGQDHDLLIFTADAQPASSAGEYELSDVILSEAKRLGAKLVVSLAAFITGGFSEEGAVYGAACSPELRSQLRDGGVKLMKEGVVTGMNGLMVGMARLEGLDSFCLLGETSGYLVDPAAAQAVLEATSRVLKIKIDVSALKERAAEARQLIGQIQGMTESANEAKTQESGGKPGYIG